MHRGLYISEIVQAIADSLSNGCDGTLLQMALSCRTFFDAAMNALWRTLRTPAYVYLVLPARVRTVTSSRRVQITASPSEAEWQRLKGYARRVYAVDHGTKSEHRKPPHSISWLSVRIHCPAGQLFPNLRRLAAHDATYDTACIAPPLRLLDFTVSYMSSIPPIACALPRCAETLEVLSIDLPQARDTDDQEYEEELSDALCELRVLTSVKIGVLYPSAIVHLASLATVRDLQFTLDTMDTPVTTLAFPSLGRLTVRYDVADHKSLSTFLRKLSAPFLMDVVIEDKIGWRAMQTTRPTAAGIQEVLYVLSSLRNLRSLVYEATWSMFSIPVAAEHILSLATLAPLLTNPHIYILDLRTLPFHLVPADVMHVAQAWPRLQCLRLGDTSFDYQPVEYLEVEDLLPLAEKCPQLHTLGLPICVAHQSLRAPVSTNGEVYSLLLNLHILRVDEDFRDHAAVFLADVFPVAYVKSDQGPSGPLQELNDLVFANIHGDLDWWLL